MQVWQRWRLDYPSRCCQHSRRHICRCRSGAEGIDFPEVEEGEAPLEHEEQEEETVTEGGLVVGSEEHLLSISGVPKKQKRTLNSLALSLEPEEMMVAHEQALVQEDSHDSGKKMENAVAIGPHENR